MAIEWNQTQMSTGQPDIDEEHKVWIRRFNEFDNAVMSGQGIQAIQSALNFLAVYAETHFAHEEARMAQLNTPAAPLNHTEHNRFRAKLSETRRWVQEEGASLVEVISLKTDLENWLIDHICTVDVQLRR